MNKTFKNIKKNAVHQKLTHHCKLTILQFKHFVVLVSLKNFKSPQKERMMTQYVFKLLTVHQSNFTMLLSSLMKNVWPSSFSVSGQSKIPRKTVKR